MVDKDMLEAIGELLAPLREDIQALKADNAEIREDLQALKADNAEIREDLQALKADNAEIREDLQAVKADTARLVTVEKTLGLLMEAQAETREKVKKLDKVAEDVEEIKIKVSALENVTRDNTSQIKELRAVK